jgi:hypothetical protein
VVRKEAAVAQSVIGREPELATAERFLDARGTAPAALLIEGEAGIGKTAIFASAVDVVDVHPYPGYVSFDELAADFRLDPAHQAKPVVMGEFGGFRFAYGSPARAAAGIMDWQVASCAYGVEGWLHWHWRGVDDPEVWTGTDGGGIVNRALSPSVRPNPCLRRDLRGSRPISLSDDRCSRAVDGSVGTAWISGAAPPGWIEVQFAQPATVREIRLVVAQFPNGATVHRLLVRTHAGVQQVQRFEGSTTDGQVLAWKPATPLPGVVAVRVETDASPSFVAWKEIEVLG